jgi:hypothetical protein
MTVPDFTPQPDEVSGILRRARRRRTRTAAEVLSGIGLALLVVAAAAGSGPADRASVEIVDRAPKRTATAEPLPAEGVAPGVSGPAPTRAAGDATAPATTGWPDDDSEPSPTASPAPDDDQPDPGTEPTREPADDSGRRDYDGDLGPRLAKGMALACQNRIVDPANPVNAVVRNGYCLSWRWQSASDARDFTMSFDICRVADSTEDGRLDFPGEEEVDFAVYRGHQDSAGQPVREEQLSRFSHEVRYDATPHSRPLLRGDCLVWELTVQRTDAHRGGLVLVYETTSTTIPAAYRENDMYQEV